MCVSALLLLPLILIPAESSSRFKGLKGNDYFCAHPQSSTFSTEDKLIEKGVYSCTPVPHMESPEVAHPVNMSVESGISITESPSQNSRGGTFSSAPASDGSKTATGYELVPYRPNPVLPMFHEPKRSFEFAGKEWNIHQQWNDVGLAAVVWEAALLLSSYLEVLGKAVMEGKRVIELGAGTGLVGFVASSLGARSVVVTDKNPTPAEANLKENLHNLLGRDISVAQYEWGTDPSHFNPPFDFVLAADVIYIEETFPLLLKSLVDLSDCETVILISCKRRYERDDRFFDLLQESGRFSYSIVHVWRWPQDGDDPSQPNNNVKVYEVHLMPI